MSTPIEPQDEPKRNILAIASFVMGIFSVAFAQFCTMPGNISIIGCFGGILAIAAVVTGVLGIRAAQQGQGKRSAISGIVLAVAGLVVFLFIFIPAMLTPGGLWTYVQATPTPTITPTPTMTPTPTITPTATPEPTSTPAPQTHYGASFAITYTDEWKKLDIDEQCQGSQSECIALYNGRTGIQLHIYRSTLPEIVDLETETERILDSFESKSILEEGEVEVGGQRGLSRTFASQYSGGTEYIRLVVVIDEYDRYIFLLVAPSEERLTRYQDEAMEIIFSTQFTTTGAPAPTAVPEVAPPTSVLPTDAPPAGHETFTGDRFTLTYPEDWQEDEDINRADICQEPGVFCLALVHPTEDGVGLQLMRYTFDRPLTTEQADQAIWAQMVAPAYDSVNLESFEKNIDIDGRLAVKRIFYGTLGDVQEHILYIVVADENDVYHFQGRTSSPEAFEQYQPILEEITFSLRFSE
ncbi:MAG: hypothetical protein JW918_09335 [Anaerolineae bacterium]|nr:hypothetical protein [Anaerolineae bacterium]